MNVCNLIWNCTRCKSRTKDESNQIGNSGEDKIFFSAMLAIMLLNYRINV